MILQKIVLGTDKESKRKAVQENLGQQVVLEDEHQQLGHAELLNDPTPDDQCYWVRFGDARDNRKLWYDDLQQLIVIANNPRFPRPELEVMEELPPKRSDVVKFGACLLAGFFGIYVIQKAIEYFQK